MVANETFKPLGILATLILICGLSYVVRKWPQDRNRTFSQHIASSSSGIIFYIALFGTVLPILLLFFIKWFIPTFNLSVWFTVFITAAAASQFLCTLIPETGGLKTKYHRFLAFVSASLLIPSILIISISSAVSLIGSIVSLTGLLIMSSVMLILVLNKAEHKNLLFLQSLYYVAFFVPILSVTYLK